VPTNLPRRIQRRRMKGWRMPDDAVYVGRPTKWGNPFRLGTPYGLAQEPGIGGDRDWDYEGRISAAGTRHDFHHADGRITVAHIRYLTASEAVELYRLALIRQPTASMRMAYPSGSFVKPTLDDARAELAGRDLVCWCPLDHPCHADVLLALANSGPSS
jgi:hypothetical protein